MEKLFSIISCITCNSNEAVCFNGHKRTNTEKRNAHTHTFNRKVCVYNEQFWLVSLIKVKPLFSSDTDWCCFFFYTFHQHHQQRNSRTDTVETDYQTKSDPLFLSRRVFINPNPKIRIDVECANYFRKMILPWKLRLAINLLLN